jgi:hypothetical protein
MCYFYQKNSCDPISGGEKLMKKNLIVLLSATILVAFVLGACTRSASGGPSDAVNGNDALPNPVSTQSQLMKEIIAGTQTAMAVPVDATPAEGEEVPEDDDEATTAATAQPKQVEATPIPLPTSTAGPPPVVELEYNNRTCGPGYYICEVSHVKDQTVVIQGTHPWLQNNMDLTFKMGRPDSYDFDKYVVVGTGKYKPDGSKGYGFRVTLNIPDALRGLGQIQVRLETNVSGYVGMWWFENN